MLVEQLLKESIPHHLLADLLVWARQEVAYALEKIGLNLVVMEEQEFLQERHQPIVEANAVHGCVLADVHDGDGQSLYEIQGSCWHYTQLNTIDLFINAHIVKWLCCAQEEFDVLLNHLDVSIL